MSLLVPVHLHQGRTPYELADRGSRFITIPGIQLHYKVYGQGNPLILLLHGFGSSTFTWDHVAPALAQLGTVFAYDRPGSGLSQRPLRHDWHGYDPYDPTEQAQLALELMHALGFEKGILIGNSAGGGVAPDIALKYPQAVQAMVLVSPAVLSGSTGTRADRAWRRRHDYSTVGKQTPRLPEQPLRVRVPRRTRSCTAGRGPSGISGGRAPLAEENPRPALLLSLRFLSPTTPIQITTTRARCDAPR